MHTSYSRYFLRHEADRHFLQLEPSTDIQCTPCFGGQQCARLLLPLDYQSNGTSNATTAIALRMIPARNRTNYRGTVLMNPGGPGESGTLYMGLLGASLSAMGVEIGFTTVAVVLAQTFVAMPYFVVALEGALTTLDPGYERVAATLGAHRLGYFFLAYRAPSQVFQLARWMALAALPTFSRTEGERLSRGFALGMRLSAYLTVLPLALMPTGVAETRGAHAGANVAGRMAGAEATATPPPPESPPGAGVDAGERGVAETKLTPPVLS